MKQELSAGSVVVARNLGLWFVLAIRDMNNQLTFPKGLIEEGEDAKEAAVRETKEETGVGGLVFSADLPSVTYTYVRDGEPREKIVRYFLFTTDALHTPVPQKEEGISDVLWIPLSKASDEIGYPDTNRAIVETAKSIVNNSL